MKYLGPVSNEKDIITKEYLEEKGNAATSTAFKMQDIPGGSDLNDYLTPGFYGVKTTAIGQTILNSPISNAFSLIVRYSYNSPTTSQRITQIISSYSQNKAEAYIRNIYSGVFGEWDKIILESDLESELSGYLPLSGGTVDGTLITDGSFQNISGGSQRGGFFKYPGTTGGLASVIFTFHETEEDAKNLTNIRSVIGHLSDGITPSYIYLAIVDTESDKNSWDQSQGLAIGKTFLRWKGTDIITKKNVVSQTSAGLMSASDKTKLDGIAIMTGATTSVAGATGLVPAPTAGKQTSFLRGDGTWVIPTNTTYSNMKGATTSAAGAAGLAPAPSAGAANRYLRSDGTWAVPPDTNTTYTLSSFGITATAAELNHLDGITATVKELNYTDGVTSNIQTQLNAKAALASPTFTGTPKAPTADAGTNTTQIATTAYVKTEINNVLAAAGALIYKGTIGTDGTITALPASHKVGDTYVVATAGNYAGETCEIGDMIICVTTRTTANNADWNIVQTNVNGAVTGPASAVTNRVATFNGTTGKVIKDSGFTIASSVPANAKFTDTTYTLSSFGITATAEELNLLDGITATTEELNHTDGVTSNIQTQLNSKFNTSGGTISGLVTPNGGFAHVGTANYIVFPDGGQSVGSVNSRTGYLQVILPNEYTSTMLKFKVSIYNYDTGTSVDYIIGGYTYSGSNTWINCTAICIGKPGASLSNLPVTFGNNGTKCVVAIGAANTSWDYPQVTISDITLGYSNTTYSTWATGWGVAWSTSALAEVDTTISNTNVSYGATPGSHTHSAANITSGTLAVARGGTGATTTEGVLTNLGITATAAELNKLDGVTTTAAEFNYVHGVTSNIQTQINNVKPKLVTVTLSSSQWTQGSNGYTQSKTVLGVSATETAQMINIIPKVSNQAAYIQAGVYASAQAANSITFTALKKPTVNLTVYVVIEKI